ncbi:hypothetical protein E1A91_D03G199200v1 [Gossypium mustelinum]|uniref:Lariat debranching enzyme C-terminal domain-containing protein n=1 Tax=Gossypium mustelinum TaxID=34275 RepID=A0A5D2VPW9_GOSMU|nr:hypothetical protein E1A91_D03G199200v1 [Gossypium mustelinum]
MQDCRQWVNSRMEDRRAEPCEFSQTAPPHKPFDSVSNATFSGSPCNPRIVSFLELLDLPYVLDNASDYKDTPASLPQKGKEFSIYLVPLSFDDVIASGM